jgi:hypothetical protein
MRSTKVDKAEKATQKKNRKLANEIFSSGPEASLFREIWGRHGPTRDFTRGSSQKRAEYRNAAVQLWRTERRFLLGSYLGICDAFDICRMQDWPLPSWVQQYLVESFPRAVFDPKAFRAGIPRVGQSELTRVQIQKHAQIVWAIKNWKSLTVDGFKAHDPDIFVRHPLEVSGTPVEKFEIAVDDHKRVDLASKILRGRRLEFRSSSVVSIERSLKAIEKDVAVRFGVSFGIDLTPQFYLWDAPFLRPKSLCFVNSLESNALQRSKR